MWCCLLNKILQMKILNVFQFRPWAILRVKELIKSLFFSFAFSRSNRIKFSTRVILLWDNLPFHKSYKVADYVFSSSSLVQYSCSNIHTSIFTLVMQYVFILVLLCIRFVGFITKHHECLSTAFYALQKKKVFQPIRECEFKQEW